MIEQVHKYANRHVKNRLERIIDRRGGTWRGPRGQEIVPKNGMAARTPLRK